jgi:nitrate/nitrite-specific signal transduction histidine kinase
VDQETRRYAEIIRAKQDRLHVLDLQAAQYGIGVPPHIAMERVSLEAELRAVEITLDSPIRAGLGDELGPRGRFVVNHEQNREIKQSIAAIAVKLDRFIDESENWRTMHRNLILLIGLVMIVILIVVVVITTYLFARGGL